MNQNSFIQMHHEREQLNSILQNANSRIPRILQSINKSPDLPVYLLPLMMDRLAILKALYDRICLILKNDLFTRGAARRTFAELETFSRLKRISKVDLRPSVWIGPYCVDLLVPSVGHRVNDLLRTRGLVIEVNGRIHESEPKMAKDESKESYLKRNGFLFKTVPNDRIRESLIDVKNAFAGHKSFDMHKIVNLQTYERRRLWQSIYILTIASHASDQEIKSVFPEIELSRLPDRRI